MTDRAKWAYLALDVARIGLFATAGAGVVEVLLWRGRRFVTDEKPSLPLTRLIYTMSLCLSAALNTMVLAPSEYMRDPLMLIACVPAIASGIILVVEIALLLRARQGDLSRESTRRVLKVAQLVCLVAATCLGLVFAFAALLSKGWHQ